jgi:hypothetical protein
MTMTEPERREDLKAPLRKKSSHLSTGVGGRYEALPPGVHVYWQGLLYVTSVVVSEAGLE